MCKISRVSKRSHFSSPTTIERLRGRLHQHQHRNARSTGTARRTGSVLAAMRLSASSSVAQHKQHSTSSTAQRPFVLDLSWGKEMKLFGVKLKVLSEDLLTVRETKENLELSFIRGENESRVSLDEGKQQVLSVTVSEACQLYKAGPKVILLRLPQGSAMITTSTPNEASTLLALLEEALPSKTSKRNPSVFNLRTDESSAKQYFRIYGYLSQQQCMLQDHTRTVTYQSAMIQNPSNFKDKVVLDIGAGTGVLSFFAVQAGARKVYSIEASNMAMHCRKLVKENNYSDKIEVIVGKVEEVTVPEKVDTIISEPLGYMLFNERTLETYLHAKKWLKEGGNMFPTKGILYAAPFNDEALYLEQFSKANFWAQTSFHGLDISCLRQEALDEYFKQPIKDTFDMKIVTADPVSHVTNFLEAQENDLTNIIIPLKFKMRSTGMVHGLAFWFDCAFCGADATVWLSTAPFEPLTHWYQIRLLLPKPMLLQKDQLMTGSVHMVANERQSYDIEVELEVTGTNLKSTSTYDLKNTHLRYMNASSPAYTVHNKDPTNSYLKNQPNKSSDVSPDSNSDSSKTQGMVQTPSYLPAPVLVPNFF